MTCAVPNRYSKAYEKLYIITTTNAQINIMINLWIVRLDSFSCFIEPISKAAFRVPTSIKRTAKKVGRMERNLSRSMQTALQVLQNNMAGTL